MTASWAFAIFATSLSYAFIARKSRGPIFWSQTVCVAFMLAKLGAYYAPVVSRSEYEWLAWVAELVTALLDCYVIWSLVRSTQMLSRATRLEQLAVILLAVHQRIRLEWHWGADLFRIPVSDAWLVPLRENSNYACLLALVMVVAAQPAHRSSE